MKTTCMRMMGGVATAAVFSLAGNAHAQEVEDINAIANNLAPAGAVLIEGVADTLVVALETQSAVDTSAALGEVVVDSGAALVQGSPTLGLLGSLGFAIVNNGIQAPVQGALAVVDDPSAQTLDGVFNPDDIATISHNLENVAGTSLREGRNGLVSLLEGNSQSAALGGLGMVLGLDTIFADTNYSAAAFGGTQGSVPVLYPATALGVVAVVGGGVVFEPADEQLAPIAEGLAPFINESQFGLPPLVPTLEGIQF